MQFLVIATNVTAILCLQQPIYPSFSVYSSVFLSTVLGLAISATEGLEGNLVLIVPPGEETTVNL